MSNRETEHATGVAVEGQHEHTVDGKGRVSIPSDFRSVLGLEEGAELVVTRHLNERCLLVYWPDAWDVNPESRPFPNAPETVDPFPRPTGKKNESWYRQKQTLLPEKGSACPRLVRQPDCRRERQPDLDRMQARV